MSETRKTPEVGAISWVDLTIDDADLLRDFYSAVVGWKPQALEMGGYNDYCMLRPAPGSETVAGICHRRGRNSDVPAQWLIYITVGDLEESAAACLAHGGRVLVGPKPAGPTARYCVIQDPAGAVAALYAENRSPPDDESPG